MRTVIILAALAQSAGAAPTLESVAAGSHAAFAAARFAPAGLPNIPGVRLDSGAPPFKTISVTAEGAAPAPQGVAAEADLKALLNAHLKSQLTVTLGGKTAYISGVFDRQQNAFLSVWVDGAASPLIFNIKGLLDKAGTVSAGSASYSLYLEANPLQPLKSKITFENKADEDETHSVRLGKLLEAIEASGKLVQLTGQAYRLFYYQDVQEGANGASLNPNSRTLALILKEGEELHVFLIPEETVPSDKMAVFKVHQNKRIGLQNANGTLRVFEL